jgi:hypothetical protein
MAAVPPLASVVAKHLDSRHAAFGIDDELLAAW